MALRKWLRLKKQSYHRPKGAALVQLHKYESDGQFDYQAYREAQIGKACSDSSDTWADQKTLDLISDYAKANIPNISFVLCHGSKSGMESTYLGDQLNCEAVGTDISPPKAAKGVVEWDFHDRREDWINRASVVYTNALDHSFDPQKALSAWIEQLAPGGLIFLEHTMLHGPQGTSSSDPFGADPWIMPYLILEWGQGVYCVQQMIKAPHKKPHWKPTDGIRKDTNLDIWIFVIGKVRPS